jgi:lambda repressor-like predicted transcriptional regulator
MRRLILLLSAFATLAAGGTPLAAQAVRESPRGALSAGPKAQGGLWKASAGYLQLSPRELRERLRAGKSLAQIAGAQGKSVDGLKAALVVAFRMKVERVASAGRIDSARAERLRERAPALVERLVHRTPHLGAKRVYARGGVLRVAGIYLRLTPKELVYELRSGTSLADVAQARGKSVDGLEAALLAALKTKVDAAVAAGRLDPARAQRLLARAPAHIDKLVNRSRG